MVKSGTRLMGVFLAVLALGSAGWSATITAQQVAARIRSRMTHQWTVCNLNIKVTPYPNNANLDKGAFKQIKVTADSVTVDGVKMTQVYMQADDPVVDLLNFRTRNDLKLVRRSGEKLHARVSEADLNRALTFKKSGIENMHLKLNQGYLIFTGRYRFGLATNLMLQGRLEVPDGYRINLVPTKASVGGIPLPAAPLRSLLNKMNPMINLKRIPLAPKVDRLLIQQGFLTVDG